MEAATPRGTARAEDPGPNAVREAAKAVPLESVRRNGNQPLSVLLGNPSFFYTKTTINFNIAFLKKQRNLYKASAVFLAANFSSISFVIESRSYWNEKPHSSFAAVASIESGQLFAIA